MTYMANTILTEGKTPSIPTPPSPPTKPIGDVKVKLGLTPTNAVPPPPPKTLSLIHISEPTRP